MPRDLQRDAEALREQYEPDADDLTPMRRNDLLARHPDVSVRDLDTAAELIMFTVEMNTHKLMADPRVVTGFNPLWKDLVYPIVVDRSNGAKR